MLDLFLFSFLVMLDTFFLFFFWLAVLDLFWVSSGYSHNHLGAIELSPGAAREALFVKGHQLQVESPRKLLSKALEWIFALKSLRVFAGIKTLFLLKSGDSPMYFIYFSC